MRKDIRYEDCKDRTDLWRPDAGRLATHTDVLFGEYLTHSRNSDW